MKNQVLGLVMVVLLLIIGANDSFAQNTEVQTKNNSTAIEQQRLDKKKSKHQSQIVVWKQQLELTDVQVATLETYLSEYVTSVQGIKAKTSLSPEEKKMAAKELRKDYDAKFQTQLTKEQQAKYDKLREARKQAKAKESIKGKSKSR